MSEFEQIPQDARNFKAPVDTISNKEVPQQKRENWLTGQYNDLKRDHPHIFAAGGVALSALTNFTVLEMLHNMNVPYFDGQGEMTPLALGSAASLYPAFLRIARKFREQESI